MSLKHYLFIIITLFVMLLAGTQLGFIHYIQQKLAQEVEQKSRTLSERAVKFLVEDVQNQAVVPKQAPEPAGIQIRIEQTPGKTVRSGQRLRIC